MPDPTPTPEMIRVIITRPELVDQGFTPFTGEIYILHFALLIAFALFVIPLLIRFWAKKDDKNITTVNNPSNNDMPGNKDV